jgi:hypothetical protein
MVAWGGGLGMGVILEKESGCGHVYIVRDAYLCGLGCIINEWVKKITTRPMGYSGGTEIRLKPGLVGLSQIHSPPG